jgi:hypothetical protein
MSNSDDNIFVISKDQAAELLATSITKNDNNIVKFSSTLLLSLVLFIICITTPILLLILTPIFFIEYIIKKIFEKRETLNNENSNTGT